MNSGMSVAQVAASTGYAYASSFTRPYRQVFAETQGTKKITRPLGEYDIFEHVSEDRPDEPIQ